MANIISRWIEERLGLVIHNIQDNFGNITKDGHLLSQLLNSYGIVTNDELVKIKSTQNQQKCMSNFDFIKHWFQRLDVSVSDEEISEIINGNGIVSINVFYKLYLRLNDKSSISFISKLAFKEHMIPDQSSKFLVEKIEEDKTNFPRKQRNDMLEGNFDIIQWHRDRVDMMIKKCELIREDYDHIVKNREGRKSNVSFLLDITRIEEESKEYTKCSEPSIDLTFENLLAEEKKAKFLRKFVPCPAESKKILKNLKNKHKSREVEVIMKRELYKKILGELWQRVKDEEKEDFDRSIIEKLVKHSYYEKQMLRKLQEVKIHKESIMESKQIIAHNISKQREMEFTEKLFGVESESKSEQIQYYFEKERRIALHKKIYEQKLKIRSERCYEFCNEIIQQICEYAMTESEYVSYYGELPRQSIINSWKQLFLAGIHLDANFIIPESLLQPPENEEAESIIQLETQRQERIDKQDFQNYLNFEPPWQLESINIHENLLNEMTSGINIIGNIVRKLLETKYPLPPAPPAPNLPKMDIAVCVNGFHATSCLQALRKLLKCKNYEIFEIQDVINFCVNAYREEMMIDVVETYDVLEAKPTGLIKKKGKKSKRIPSVEKQVTESDVNHERAEKKVQTPKYFPWEEIVLTHQAELGKIAEEELARGKSLTNFLIVAMFVEYLKSKPHIKGWVLLNFPTNLQQIFLLEQTLSANQIPDVLQTMTGSLTEIMDGDYEIKGNDQNNDSRQSRIFKFRKVSKNSKKKATVLTAYIQLINEKAGDEVEPDSFVTETLTSNLSQNDPENFYTTQGCYHKINYTEFDFHTIKNLAKIIVGHLDVPPKSSAELFGDTIKILYTEMGVAEIAKPVQKKAEKKPVKKIVEVKEGIKEDEVVSPESIGNLPRRTKSLIEHEDKATQMPELEEEMDESDETEDVPKAGETGWKFLELTPPEELTVILATLWENTEEIYIADLSQVFFLKRILLSEYMPFVKFVKDHMKSFFNKPNIKQMVLREFQNVYNIFDQDIRNDDDFKAEYHCRIKEMRGNLLNICDETMLELERERQEIINQGWIPRYLIELTNNYINALQLELDRFVDTFNLLGDYYTGIVTKYPNDDTLIKDILPKISLEDAYLCKEIDGYLKEVKLDTKNNPLIPKIEEIMNKCLAFVHKMTEHASTQQSHVTSIFVPNAETVKDKKKRSSKKGLLLELNDELRENFDKIIKEWTCGIKGEAARVSIYLKLLKNDLVTNVGELYELFLKTLSGIHEQIRSRYRKEVESVENLCNLFARAVEAEFPIKQELVITEEDFFLNVFSNLLQEKEEETKQSSELPDEVIFKISELDYIRNILFDMAPSGFIAERSLVFLLQDILTRDDIHDKQEVPYLWSKLTPKSINKLSSDLFGDNEYSAWKDFIIRNLLIPYPEIDELLKLRKKFLTYDEERNETITEENYREIQFWYEEYVQNEDRLKEMKELLFKLYTCNENQFNYTAMMLDFCKGQTVPEGFGKAISMCIGKPVCWNDEIGKQFVDDTLMKRIIHEEKVRRRSRELRQHIADISGIIEDILSVVVRRCDSLIIEEISEDEIKVKRKGDSKKDLRVSNGKMRSRTFSKTSESKGFESKTRKLKPSTSEIQGIESKTRESQSKSYISSKDEEKVINVTIDCEKNVNPLTFFITFDVIKDVLSSVFWNVSVTNIEDKSVFENAEDIFNESRRDDFNSEVLVHEYLNNPKFLNLLRNTPKFLILNPTEIVKNLVNFQQQ